MSKRRLMFILLAPYVITWLWGCGIDEPNAANTSAVFVKYHGSDAEEKAVDLVETEKGYLILGQRTQNAISDIYLVATDDQGNELWNKTISNNDNIYIQPQGQAGSTVSVSNDIPSAITLYENKTKAIIVGTSSFDRKDDNEVNRQIDHMYVALVNLMDPSAPVEDTTYRYYDKRINPSWKAMQGADALYYNNGFIILGATEATSDDSNPEDANYSLMLSHFSEDLKTIKWQRLYGYSGDDYGRKLLRHKERYYYMGAAASVRDFGKGLTDVLVGEFNPTNGLSIQQRLYGTFRNDEPRDIIYTPSALVVVGTSGSGVDQYAFMQRIAHHLPIKALEENRRITYPNPGTDANWNTQGSAVARTPEGNILVLGSIVGFSKDGKNKGNDIFLARTEPFGSMTVKDTQAYGGVENDEGVAMVVKKDGAIVIAATVDFGGGAKMIALLKTYKNGKLTKR